MSRLLLLAVAVTALVAAGCGSSSKSSTAKPPAASTPATPSTSTTASLPKPPASTPISSPVMRTYLIGRYQQALTAAKLSTAKAAPLADCVLKKLESQGVKTYAQAKSAQAQVTADQRACAKQIGLR